LGKGKATYKLQVFGLEEEGMYANLPGGTFDVSTYAQIVASTDKIMNGLTKETPIDPVFLEIPTPAKP
jgi:hypothetical protein